MKESKTLEFKSGKTSSFLKTVSAYANYGVGTIEFGRQDNGETQVLLNLCHHLLQEYRQPKG